MQYGAIDLHRRSSVICLAGPADGSYEEQTVATSQAALTSFFAGRERCRILIESSTESQWVARLLEELGHYRKAHRSSPPYPGRGTEATRWRKLT
jgi:transposase